MCICAPLEATPAPRLRRMDAIRAGGDGRGAQAALGQPGR